MRYIGRKGFHAYEGVAIDTDERARIIADPGANDVLLLRNHGVLTVGRSIAEAFMRINYFEKAVPVQLMAQAAVASGPGLRFRPPTPLPKRRVNSPHGRAIFWPREHANGWPFCVCSIASIRVTAIDALHRRDSA